MFCKLSPSSRVFLSYMYIHVRVAVERFTFLIPKLGFFSRFFTRTSCEVHSFYSNTTFTHWPSKTNRQKKNKMNIILTKGRTNWRVKNKQQQQKNGEFSPRLIAWSLVDNKKGWFTTSFPGSLSYPSLRVGERTWERGCIG